MSDISRRALLGMGAFGAVGIAGLGVEANATGRDRGGESVQTCCPIVELRQYTLHPGTRDGFTSLFEREFVESQEALGMTVIGQFHDLDDPDRFVWMRGFADMEARRAGLTAFYGGEIWQAHRAAANASILDSDNVLLLRQAAPGTGLATARLSRRTSAATPPAGVVVAAIHYVDAALADAFADFFDARMQPALARLGLPPIARFRTEGAANNFPRLPVRTSDTVFVWLAVAADAGDSDRRLRAFRDGQAAWREGAGDPFLHQLARKPEFLRLVPTPRSALRG
jgi:hypothetical protein